MTDHGTLCDISSIQISFKHARLHSNAKTAAGSICVALVHLANVMLRIEFKPELGDEIELGFEKVDVMLLIRHELLEEIACHVIPHAVAMRGRFLIKGAGRHFGS